MLASCAPPANAGEDFDVAFVVESDPGVRLRGASIFVDGKSMGETDSNGLVRAQIHSEPDRSLRIDHHCPAGHADPSEPKRLRLRKFEGFTESAPAPMEITLRCPPTRRLAVFVVRAKNGPDLPVLLDGEMVTRTNATGVAHLSSWAAAGTQYSIRLDTDGQPRLVPPSPTRTFTLPDADEIFVFNQSFEIEKAPERRGRRRARIIKIE